MEYKIIEVFKKYSKSVDTEYNVYNCLIEEDWSNIAQEVVKLFRQPDVMPSLPCGCLKCYPNVFPNLRFNVCPICGNKRCPHASDHSYECTNSNDVGQTGSVYGGNDR